MDQFSDVISRGGEVRRASSRMLQIKILLDQWAGLSWLC